MDKVYIETTMFNILYEKDLPQYADHKADSQKVFALIKAGRFEPYTSDYVIEELVKTSSEEKLEKMLRLIPEYGIKTLGKDEEAEQLAGIYIADKVVSPAWPSDALHIAMTAVNGLDFIVSLNFTHIVRDWTIERVERINAREGYRKIGIYRPSEVLEL
jgi:predicted nucleic acid-binding protein